MIWFVSRREHTRLWREYREMQDLYWQQNAVTISQRIDIENLERELQELKGRIFSWGDEAGQEANCPNDLIDKVLREKQEKIR